MEETKTPTPEQAKELDFLLYQIQIADTETNEMRVEDTAIVSLPHFIWMLSMMTAMNSKIQNPEVAEILKNTLKNLEKGIEESFTDKGDKEEEDTKETTE